ncbi:hypothetical protein FRAHR75_460002 [Frankia sp. Hr75.2]|nr:hypothetical protein FRAHR75_460002 [Frankia sp. Hr75.2]
MRVLHVTDVSGAADVRQILLPYRDARDKGPYDVIPGIGLLARPASDRRHARASDPRLPPGRRTVRSYRALRQGEAHE